MNCDVCGENGAHQNHTLNLCDDCDTYDDLTFITKSDAINRYLLSRNELGGVRHAKKNNRYSNSAPYCLFLISDIEELAIKKHGSVTALRKAKKEKEKSKRAKHLEQLRQMERNRKEMRDYLLNFGLYINDDNPLCQAYIHHGKDCEYTLTQIGAIMEEEKFYNDKTNFKGIEKRLTRELWRSYSNGNPAETRLRIKEAAKEDALIEFVQDNNDNMHYMMKSVPYSLLDDVMQLSEKIYDKN